MSNDDLLQEYENSIRRLQRDSINAGINKEDFEKMYFENIKSLTKEDKTSNVNRSRKKYFYILSCCVAAILLCYNFKTVYSCFICNVQDYIYPGLRLIRKVSIPIISLFPSLTQLYQETCLLQNPFFTVVDMDCWPCSTVNNVGEVYDPQPVHQQHNAPFIYKTEQTKVNVDTLKMLYNTENIQNLHNDDQILIDSKHNTHQSIFSNEKNLFIWKINNIDVARALRKLIPRPKVVPKFGQSVERFIIIDSKHDLFHIPDTECNYSFLLVTDGHRIVELKPAEECKYQCKSLKVELRESYLLWYNWWYWRPVVQQSSSNKTFIAHVGSYC